MDTLQPLSRAAVRRPVVAGYYYPADPAQLRQMVDALTQRTVPPKPALAVLVPHGSYRYAGAIAGATVARVTIPRRCILLGASHTGSWMRWSLMAAGAYRTPLGDVPVDELCAEALRSRCPFLEVDAWSQRGEHAIEVVLPFLQRVGPPDLAILPVVTGPVDDDECLRLGEALAQVIRMYEEPVLLIASSDLSHYEPNARALRYDQRVMAAIRRMDRAALRAAVQTDGVPMCGYGAVVSVLEAAQRLGAHAVTLVRYGTSAEAGGDPHSVIGYAGMVVR